MAQLIKYVDELIQEVGPRPAGTQQEHQAAELIAARLDELGMKVDIEEFPCARNIGWVRILYYALCLIGVVVSIFLAEFRIIGSILIAVGVILMILDYMGKNPLFTLFKSSLSQNVIARYQPPGSEPTSRSRKVVILAHYDSARTMVQAAPLLVPYYALLRRGIRAAMALLIVIALLMLIPFPTITITVLSVLLGIVAAVVLLAFLAEVVNLFMPYNQGANCNGSSVGVLYGLAQILSTGEDIATARKASEAKGRRSAGRRDAEGSPDSASVRGAERGSSRGSRGAREGERAGGRSGRAKSETAAAARGLLGRLQDKIRPAREESPTSGKSEKDLDSQPAREESQVLQQETSVDEREHEHAQEQEQEQEQQTAAPSPTPIFSASAVKSVSDNLANPFISQRPPLSEIEEANRLREEERLRRLEEQRKRAQADEGRTADGVPLWFVQAKQNAEKKTERRQRTEETAGVVRSRFADVPTAGRLKRESEEQAEAAEAAAEAVEGVAGVEGAAAAAADTAAAAATATAAAATAEVTAATPAVGEQVVTGVVAGVATGASQPVAAEFVPEPIAHERIAGEPIERPKPIVKSEVAAVAQPEPESQRQVVPVTVTPDFSGLDRQAFKVLPNEEAEGVPAIVPGQAEVAEDPFFSADEALFLFEDDDTAPDVVKDSTAGAATEGLGELFLTSTRQSRQNRQNRLFDLPTLAAEGATDIPVQQAGFDTEPVAREELFSEKDSVVSATGSFVPLGTTGVMKPIGGELLDYHDEGEIYIQDADDTAIGEHYSQAGTYAEPDLVNIPESRVKSFLGSVGDRLSGKKKERLEDSPASWLGVDEHFDARKEGSAIGSWDNFDEGEDDWRGGAYGGADYEENVRAVVNLSHELLNKEVWLVALGANESKNAGLANLFATHSSELKSALFINLLGVGIGDLVFTVSEGNYRPAQTDHRMQSLISSAAQNMAIPIAPVKFSAFATDCTETLKRGGRAISIMGLGKQVPVGWRWSDDEVSRLREENMLDTAALVIETIKNS
jgi:hypothetical protein